MLADAHSSVVAGCASCKWNIGHGCDGTCFVLWIITLKWHLKLKRLLKLGLCKAGNWIALPLCRNFTNEPEYT
jgi:hypothetical protein